MSSPNFSQSKRRRLSSIKQEIESSIDSFSYSNYPSESEEISDSEFEEHPYSSLKCKLKSRRRFHQDTYIKENKRSKCTSKNAVMARLNRLKKKKYIEDLENKNAELKAENQMLKNMLDARAKEVVSLKKKTLNLESVIRNRTEIGSLLKCVRQHTNLEISSSILHDKCTNPPSSQVNLGLNDYVGEPRPSSSNHIDLDVSPSELEALVAAVLWGMVLHTFCQPYKLKTST